jgi:hypothetical protein
MTTPWQDGYTHPATDVHIDDNTDLTQVRETVQNTMVTVQESFRKISWSETEAQVVYEAFKDSKYEVRNREHLLKFHELFKRGVSGLSPGNGFGLIINLLCVIFAGEANAGVEPVYPDAPVVGQVVCDDFWRLRLQALLETLATAVPPLTDAGLQCEEPIEDFVVRAQRTSAMKVTDAIAYYQQYMMNGHVDRSSSGSPVPYDLPVKPTSELPKTMTAIPLTGHPFQPEDEDLVAPTWLQRHPFNHGAGGGGYVPEDDDGFQQ